MGVASVLVILGGCEKVKDRSDEKFIQNCQQHCMSQGMQFDAEASLASNPNTCICTTTGNNYQS